MTQAPTRSARTGTRCLSVVVGPRRYDVAVDEELLLSEVIDLVFPGGLLVAVTMTGEPLPLDQRVADAHLETGSMILTTWAAAHVAPPRVRRASHAMPAASAPGGGGTRSAVGGRGPWATVATAPGARELGTAGSRAAPAAVVSASAAPAPVVPGGAVPAVRHTGGLVRAVGARRGRVLVAVLLSALTVVAASRSSASSRASWFILGAALLLGGAGLAVAQIATADRLARLASPALGAAAGSLAALTLADGALVPLVGGCAGAVLVALAGRMTTGADRHVPRVWLALAAGVGLLSLMTLGLRLPMATVACLALAVSVLLTRVVPNLVLDVDDDVLLDIDRLSVTSWSPREARRRLRRGWRIDDRAVGSVVVAAGVEQLSALVAVGVVSVASSAILLAVARGREETAVRLLLLAAALATACAARSYRLRRDRTLLRVAAVAPLLAVAVSALAPLDPSAAVVAAGTAVAAGLGMALLSAAVGGGFRSLGAARVADAAELLGMLSVLPLALWAGGLVDRALGFLG